MPATIERSTTIFTGDLIEHAQDYALGCAASGDFPTILHVVSGEEITTTPFALGGLAAPDLTLLASMASGLVEASQVSWVALQTPVWMNPTGDIAALYSEPKPHVLASEALAILVIDGEGTDFYVAEVQRREDSVNLLRWHMVEQGPNCDANGVCS